MASEIVATQGDRPLRRDAARNRELILETAAVVFAEHGLDAGYDEIARRAGIGVGTVYRRFPERAELVQALFESRVQEIVAIAEDAVARAEPWDALALFLERTIERQVADRGFKEVMTSVASAEAYRMIGRERLGPIIEQMVARAQETGLLRRDVAASDIGVQLMLVSSLATAEQPDLWRRYLALFLDGLRDRPDLEPLPLVAPADEDIHALMCNVQGR